MPGEEFPRKDHAIGKAEPIGKAHQAGQGASHAEHLEGQLGKFVTKLGERLDSHMDPVALDQGRLDDQEGRRGGGCRRQTGDRVRVGNHGDFLRIEPTRRHDAATAIAHGDHVVRPCGRGALHPGRDPHQERRGSQPKAGRRQLRHELHGKQYERNAAQPWHERRKGQEVRGGVDLHCRIAVTQRQAGTDDERPDEEGDVLQQVPERGRAARLDRQPVYP